MAASYACPKCRAEAHVRGLEEIKDYIRRSTKEAREYSMRAMCMLERCKDLLERDNTYGTNSWTEKDTSNILAMKERIMLMFDNLQVGYGLLDSYQTSPHFRDVGKFYTRR